MSLTLAIDLPVFFFVRETVRVETARCKRSIMNIKTCGEDVVQIENCEKGQ